MEVASILFHLALLGGLLLLLICTVINAAIIPVARRPEKRAAEASAKVSILVPARNEEHNIGPCLESLMAQDYPDFEVVVLDDRSEDRTGEIAGQLGFREGDDGRFRLVKGAELPTGWAGKNWACHQLSEAARGDYLIFTDADTEHEPWSISAAVGLSQEHGAGLVSLWPKQETKTWSEKWILPLLYVLGAGFMSHLPAWMVVWSDRFAKMAPASVLRHFGAANGQFLCFTREGYALVGGHAGMKDDLVEDVRFGRETLEKAAEGGKLVNADGRKALRCRMYRDFGELWSGFSKNIWPAVSGDRVLFTAMASIFFILMLFPFFALPFADGIIRDLIWAEIGLIFTFRLLIWLRYEVSLRGAVFHVPALFLGMAIAANSARLAKKGGLPWKGRTYHPTGGESEA